MLLHQQIQIKNGSIHVVENGVNSEAVVLFLHGWPENWKAYEKILEIAGGKVRAIAIDLPGIGGSVVAGAPGAKGAIAECIHELAAGLKLKRFTLVGQDCGGMIAFSYLCRYFDELSGVVIMNTVVPGLKPWQEVVRNPYVWHFRFHDIPDLAEQLVAGKQRPYFDYFYKVISAHPEKITQEARDAYCEAYASPAALSAGFNWYRAFKQDAEENGRFIARGEKIPTRLLYLRGQHEGGDLAQYGEGFKAAGIVDLQTDIIADSGHFAPEEQPELVWRRIADFMQG